MFRRMPKIVLPALILASLAGCASTQGHKTGGTARPLVQWINPLNFLAGDPSVRTSFNAFNSGVGSGLSGLIIESTTVGDNKVVEVGLQVPPGHLVTGVRICYQVSNARSFINLIRLAQLQNPPSSMIVQLDDGMDQTNPGPVCVDSQPTSIDPAAGAIFLSFRFSFGNTADRIVVRGVGLHLLQKLPLQP